MRSITTPTEEEFRRQRSFYENNIRSGMVFSARIEDVPCRPEDFRVTAVEETEEEDRIECFRRFEIGTITICQYAKIYKDLPIVEWYLTAENVGKTVSPKFSFNAVDCTVEAGYSTLYHHNGSDNRPDDHQPKAEALGPGRRVTIAPLDGRSTNQEYPYFSLAMGNYGLNIALGYLGQWQATFTRVGEGVRICCGQQRLNSVILPGEQFRSPRVILQCWEYRNLHEKYAVRRAQNIFRKYMRRYNMPRYADGSIPTHGLTACSSHQFLEMIYATTKDQKEFIDLYDKRGISLDYWWCDAGWYPCDHSWDEHLGSWRYDERRFPNGIREIADYAKERGKGLVLWHEIERFRTDSDLYREHPEFALARDEENPNMFLINFGDRDAVDWVINKITNNLKDYGVTIYRQDMNVDLLPFIEANETPERQGALENHYMMGMLRYWDSLRENISGLMIDMCAAGGRRQDPDALKRALIFIRSDWLFEPTSQQCHMGWMSEWIPFAGTGVLLGPSRIDNRQVIATFDRYAIVSCFCSHLNSCFDVRDENMEWDKIKPLFDEWHDFVECYSGDYYPLTEITLTDDNWAAWQFNRFEEGDGVIQAFRRPFSPDEERTFRLFDLDPEKNYRLHRYDTGDDFVVSGRELTENGLRIQLPPRSSAEIKYTAC